MTVPGTVGNPFFVTFGESFSSTLAASTTSALQLAVTGDADVRWEILASGKQTWGDGTNPGDTNLYRSAANTLKTDDAFVVGAGLTLTDATDVTIGTSTGTTVGQSGSKLGFFGHAPVARNGAYTQTFSTAARTVPNATAVSVATTAATQTTPFGFSTGAQADAIVTNLNALIVDVDLLKRVINALIDDSQALGFAT